MQVKAALVRRRVVHVSPTGKKRSFSCNHCFAQMVFCGDCGELYRRVHWNNHSCKSIVWRCISRLEPISAEKNCTNRTVNELLLQEITIKAIHQILTERDIFLKTLQQNYFLSSAFSNIIGRSTPHTYRYQVHHCRGIRDSFEHVPISYLYKNDDTLPCAYPFPSNAVQDFLHAHHTL